MDPRPRTDDESIDRSYDRSRRRFLAGSGPRSRSRSVRAPRERGRTAQILAPNGTLEDVQRSPVYDPAAVSVPTLVSRPSLDTTSTEDALGLYDALEVPEGRAEYAEFDGATHVIHLERRRRALYDAVYAFQGRVP